MRRDKPSSSRAFEHPAERIARGRIRLLLLLPFIGVAAVYSAADQTLFALPLVAWHAFIWSIVAALSVCVVYRAETRTALTVGRWSHRADEW